MAQNIKKKIFKDLLVTAGIKHRTSNPYSLQQNGLVERLNRILVENARCTLIIANLQTHMWSEAIMTVAHITKRTPTTALNYATPEEK